jgi:hypothetical protein
MKRRNSVQTLNPGTLGTLDVPIDAEGNMSKPHKSFEPSKFADGRHYTAA